MDDKEAGRSAVAGPVTVQAGRLIQPSMALALNMHASPGVYALLLGSGISIASGVKTGWGVVQDLVGKVAAVQSPGDAEARAAAMECPEQWWESNYGETLGYSGLLAAVAPTPAARQALLAGYFEPEDDEDDKGPTAAHRAIARLVKRGSVKVILTTNFDRLMERALQEAGISPQVVRRPDEIDPMMPLPHSQITVIKLHGDYADLDQRNTVDELETYPQEQQQLLDRVLDEYGLVVCGWSADWDEALVRAVEGTRSRRYPMFWSHYGQLGHAASRLAARHRAVVLEGLSADELFTDLLQRVEALDHLSVAPISRDVAVVQLKRALPDPVRRIELFDLVGQAVTAVVDGSTIERRPLTPPSNAWADTFADSVRGYRADSDTVLHLLANGVFHDDGTHDQLWQSVVTRLVRLRDTTPSQYNEYLEKLRHLPALMATWAIGVAAVLSRREELLAGLLARPAWARPGFGRPRQQPVSYLNPNRVVEPEGLNYLYRQKQGNGYLYPQSRWLKDELREPFQLVEPSDHGYLEACTRFEYLTSMIAMDEGRDARAYPWAGEFLLDDIWNYNSPDLSSSIEQELTVTWPLLRAGAFGGDVARAKAAHQALAEWRARNPRD